MKFNRGKNSRGKIPGERILTGRKKSSRGLFLESENITETNNRDQHILREIERQRRGDRKKETEKKETQKKKGDTEKETEKETQKRSKGDRKGETENETQKTRQRKGDTEKERQKINNNNNNNSIHMKQQKDKIPTSCSTLKNLQRKKSVEIEIRLVHQIDGLRGTPYL